MNKKKDGAQEEKKRKKKERAQSHFLFSLKTGP
jgi:hypothetical protein